MAVGQRGAPIVTVLTSVEEGFNTSEEYVTIQGESVSNIASNSLYQIQ